MEYEDGMLRVFFPFSFFLALFFSYSSCSRSFSLAISQSLEIPRGKERMVGWWGREGLYYRTVDSGFFGWMDGWMDGIYVDTTLAGRMDGL